MTRHPPVRFLLAALTAGFLGACGGGDVGVDETAAGAGISSEQQTEDPSASAEETSPDGDDVDGDDVDGDGVDGGFPGGPGSDPDGNDGDAGGGGNPGAPGDVAVFEEAGVTFGTLRNGSAQSVCVEQGLCTLADPVVTAGDPDDLGGVDECLIREQSDIHYDPPAGGGVFPEGATVTAHVDCTDPDAEESGGTDSGDPGTDDSMDDSTDDPPEDDGTDGSTEDDGTDGSTEDDGTDGSTEDDGTDTGGTDDQPQE